MMSQHVWLCIQYSHVHHYSTCPSPTRLSLSRRHSLKSRHPDVFRSARIYLEVSRLLVTYTFRLPARRFVLFELFDKVAFAADQLAQWYEQPLLGGGVSGGSASANGARASVGNANGTRRHGSQFWTPPPPPPPMP